MPDGSSDYEVKTTLTFNASGGTFVTYLRASSDALSGPSARGTYYAVELQNVTLNGANCSAQWTVYKRVSGVVTLLYSIGATMCYSGMTVRIVMSGNQLFLYTDNVIGIYIVDSDIRTGQPGIGVHGAAAGNSIAQVQLGPLDRVAPNPFNPNVIGTSVFPTRVDIQWQGVTDDSNGTGIAFYQVWKNGAYVANVAPNPVFSDPTLSPSTSYSYRIVACDFHMNSVSQSFTVATPPANNPDPRRVGVRPTGSYWGASGENIDLLSGNLSFSLPLLKAQGRGGWSVPFRLSYNSQNWRQDPGGTWNLGRDVGYGYGWKLLAGSLTPYWSDWWTIHHYLFTDSTGAEYILDTNNNGVWTSRESIYLAYDSNTQRLYFPDGSFWVFGDISAGSEQDAGSRYPTAMEDTNGNQILVRYDPGVGATWTNSSARIQEIEDVRAVNGGSTYRTYSFTYNNNPIPHLTGISNSIGTAEGYTFTYNTNQPLASPFNGQSFGSTTLLSTAQVSGIGVQHSFQYDSSAELTRVTLPYNGYLRWAYTSYTYNGSRTLREVGTRYLSRDGSSEDAYPFYREGGGSVIHNWAIINDPGNAGQKLWVFNPSGTYLGLIAWYEGRQLPDLAVKTHENYYWTQDSAGNYYMGTSQTILDPGQSYQATKQTSQTLDTWGNVTQRQVYDYNNLSTPARTYTYSYLGGSDYTSRHIYNRLTTATVTQGSVNKTIVQNGYDQGNLSQLSGLREWDSSYASISQRGNVTASTTPGGVRWFSYDYAGNTTYVTVNGVTSQVTNSASTNYAAPTAITTANLNEIMSWTSFLGLASDTNPNGATASTYYDAYARPSSTTSPFGATTGYSYSVSPPTVTATTNGRWSKTTLDGLGRTIKVETGHGSTTVSAADTEYAPCACSPLGKVSRVSMPYAPGATRYWTTYTYDALGRTVSVVKPDGASATSYLYQGNTVKVTDPAGKWKLFTMDANGNLTHVTEPNPSGGANYETSYTYDGLNHLATVSMPRGGYTQTRTFTYSGDRLTSATNPENGTVSYTYNSNYRIASKLDAKNQQVQYSYDSLMRLTQVRRYPVNGSDEDTCQQTNFYYDTNPFDGSYSQYIAGRLAAVQYKGPDCTTGNPTTFTEMYSYNQAGARVKKRLRLTRGAYSNNADLDAAFTYDNEGRMTQVSYPLGGPTYDYTVDSMGRLFEIKDHSNSQVITSATYGPSGELLSLNGQGYSYNNLLQLTQVTGAGMNLQYRYSATQNNGKITSQYEAVSGEEVTYTYDALNRLATAVTSDNPNVPQWGQRYNYDGFGNQVGQDVIKGTAPSWSTIINPATNREYYAGDANGNLGPYAYRYDIENRLVGDAEYSDRLMDWSYDVSNQRVYRRQSAMQGEDPVVTDEEVYFYSVTGQKLGNYGLTASVGGTPPHITLTLTERVTNTYFGSKLIGRRVSGSYSAVVTDRLNSIGKYYPYGQEKNPTADDKEKFATYTRDSVSGLDYANQRYYQPGFGRFLSPDPYKASASVTDPNTWNRYAYAGGDPIKFNDPSGTLVADPDTWDILTYWDLWGWIPWGGPGAGGGGSIGSEDIEYANGLISRKELEKRRAERLAEILAAVAKLVKNTQDPSTWPEYAAYIRVVDDCWESSSSISTTYTRVVTYEVLDEFGAPMYGSQLNGVTITEAFPMQTGNLGLSPGAWSRSDNSLYANGTFVDLLSAGGGIAGVTRSGDALQTFTATGPWGIPVPLDILGFGVSVGVLYNTYTPATVTINGTTAVNQCTRFY